jgi:RNA 2',3'-cyclic 3'-phosphodiesterase
VEPLRTFIAIEPDPAVRAWLGECLESLRRRAPGVRWVRPEHLHLTLRFLGDVEASRSEALGRILGAACGPAEPFRVAFGATGVFGSRHTPRTLWLGLLPGRDLDLLQALVRRLEDGLVEAGFGREDRPWSPHLTLGRNPDGRPLEGWEAGMAPWKGSGAPAFQARTACLFRSELTPRGPIHTLLQEFPIGAAAGAGPRSAGTEVPR